MDERKLPLVANERRYPDQELVPFFSLALRSADTYGRLLHYRSRAYVLFVNLRQRDRAIAAG